MSQNIITEKIKAGAKIIDVRTPDEFADEHYENAINIPVNQIGARINEIGDKNQSIIVYCASGGRSASAAQILKTNGFKDVTNAGGLGDMP
jgi:phage shock protein E